MDKNQRISWGVSFGSLALVAGMVSYLGIANGDKTNNQIALNQGQPSTDNSNQQSQDGFNSGQGPVQRFDNSTGGDNSSQFNQNDGSPSNNSDNSNQFSGKNDQSYGNSNQQDQFSNGGGQSFGHHGGFDTTTGGT